MDRLQTPIFGTDSTSQVPNHAAEAIGAKFACRYLGHYLPKVVTRDEYNSYMDSGHALAVVFEDQADAAVNGYEYGKGHAEFALKQLQDRTGHSGPIIFAVDVDPSSYRADAFDGYFDGCAAVLSHDNCGPYGGFAVVKRQMDRGFKRAWQTYAWSANQFDRRAQMIQYSNDHWVGGVQVDFNHAYYEDYNQLGYKPAVVDPNHYRIYDTTTRPDLRPQGLNITDELGCVKLYDKYRAQQRKLIHPHRKELDILKKQCAWFFGRLRTEARKPHNGGWNAYHRGERGQGLYHRYLGMQVAK